MEHIATMDSCESAMPDNIGTAVALEIKQPCGVVDAYRILDDYPNIKHVKVAGQNYTSTEIKQMGIGERLGIGGRAMPVFIENIAEDRDPVPDPAPALPTGMQWRAIPPSPYLTGGAPAYPWSAFEVPPPVQPPDILTDSVTAESIQEGLQQYQREYIGQWREASQQATARSSYRTDENYRRYFEHLMRNNPAYAQFGDLPVGRPMTAVELANQNAIRGTTADMVWYDEVSTADSYHPPF